MTDRPVVLSQLGRIHSEQLAEAFPEVDVVPALADDDLPDSWITEPPEQWNLADLGTLDGRRVGLIGLGAIGSAVASRAEAFGCVLRAVRRTGAPSDITGVDVTTDLPALVGWCDHLVIAAAATPDTRQLVDTNLLVDLGPGAHLVNIARGSIIDHEALRVALDDGRVARASLDVVDPEPLPPAHWLFDHPSVRLSAHVSWSAPDSWERAVDGFHANLGRWLADEPLEDVVDLGAGY